MGNKPTLPVSNEELLTRGVAPLRQRLTLAVLSICLQIASGCGAYGLWSQGGWTAATGGVFQGLVFLLASYSLFRAWIQRRERMPASFQPAYHTADAIICQKVNAWGGTRSIVLDRHSRHLHFYRCFTPAQFLARPKRWYSCQLDDVTRIRSPWQGFCIDTDAGSAVIAYGSRLEELRDALQEVIAARAP